MINLFCLLFFVQFNDKVAQKQSDESAYRYIENVAETAKEALEGRSACVVVLDGMEFAFAIGDPGCQKTDSPDIMFNISKNDMLKFKKGVLRKHCVSSLCSLELFDKLIPDIFHIISNNCQYLFHDLLHLAEDIVIELKMFEFKSFSFFNFNF